MVHSKKLIVPLISLPIPIRVNILNYFGPTQEELRILPLVSKGFYEDCNRPGIDWKIIPTLILRPLDGGSVRHFVQNMNRYQIENDGTTYNKLQRYRKLIVQDIHNFRHKYIWNDEIERLTNGICMDWIFALVISSSSPTTFCGSLLHVFAYILPNVREIDLTDTSAYTSTVLLKFSERCPHLEKVKWNNSNCYIIAADGYHMPSSHNLKEIDFDNCSFDFYNLDNDEKERMIDLNNHPDVFLFYKFCSKFLERVSIRDADHIPQNTLVKFVRNAPPTLKWFRSDLTKKSMDVLQSERPGIELLN